MTTAQTLLTITSTVTGIALLSIICMHARIALLRYKFRKLSK